MRPIAYVSLPIAEFREKVNDFGHDYEELGKWVMLFSRTLAMMGSNEPKDEFALRLLNDVENFRKEKAEKMRRMREEKKGNDTPIPQEQPKVVVGEVVQKDRPLMKHQVKKVFGEMHNVTYTEDEEMKLREKLGTKFDRAVSILSNYKASSGKRYKSDYAATLNWVVDRVHEEDRKASGNMSQAQRLAMGMLGVANG